MCMSTKCSNYFSVFKDFCKHCLNAAKHINREKYRYRALRLIVITNIWLNKVTEMESKQYSNDDMSDYRDYYFFFFIFLCCLSASGHLFMIIVSKRKYYCLDLDLNPNFHLKALGGKCKYSR